MAADVSLPNNLEYNHDTFIKIGLALAYSTPFYRTLTINEAVSDLYDRTSSNLTSEATISQILGPDFQRTEQEIPIFQALGEQKAVLVALFLDSYFQSLPHENIHYMLLVPAIILPILALIAVILRFFTRCFITNMVRLEDWLIIPGLILAIVISIVIAMNKAVGVHIWDVPMNKILYIWRVVIFMVLDVVIVLLPIPYILRLQLKKREKVLTIGLFSLGALVVFASGMKVARLHDLAYNVDTTWQIDNLQWTVVELNLGIICACAPSFRHLTSRSRLKRLYHERIKPLRRFFNPKARDGLEDRKSSVGTSEATASSRDLALQKLNTNATNPSSAALPIPRAADIRVLNPHHRRTFAVGARTSSLPAIELISTIKPSHLHPSPTFKPRPNLKILSRDDIDLIEQGYPGLGPGTMDAYNYSEDEEIEIERESIYTHDLTRASSRALPEELENCGFSILPKDAAAFRAG
ncbi:hypothetical protein TWF730_010414 [Orbilia blumenaviensis]|uniref:Rhodopsin domain-containing protein n=1 Tax=Orbilia blumenaviensis TaxID=1796055 RepID=A0AAV9UNK8_9PEZI